MENILKYNRRRDSMYKYICEKCNCEFETKKKNQLYCSKSCANSVNASKRKIYDKRYI